MAEETVKTESSEAVVVSDVPEVEKETAPPAVTAPEVTEKTVSAEEPAPEKKIAESTSFKEETNVVGELPDPHKVALDELKHLVQEALNKHEFTAPVALPAVKVDEPPVAAAEEKSESAVPVTEEVKPVEETTETEPPVVEEPAKCEPEVEEKVAPPEAESSETVAVEKVETVCDDGAKTVEAIEETVVAVVAPEEPPVVEVPVTEPVVAEVVTPPPPEEVSIWGIPLLADERSDVILLKFLRARDFKVKEAFAMLKSVVAWRKEFGIEELLEEDFGSELEKVVFMHGVDKEGHPVCYNAFGEFSNKELYLNTFSDEEKRTKFLRWRIQFLEKSIRKLDFSPDGISTIVQVNDLKNSPGFFAKELRQATNQALQLLQDNYPEFVAKQVVVNVPWWYLAYYRMISPFFTQRTKSKLVFVGPSKTAETLYNYIAPEQVPVQFGGLSREGEQEFTTGEPATEEIIKPACKHTIEIPVTETCVSVWEARVVGLDVSYAAEFVPVEGYTIIVQKSRKVGQSDEPVICGSYKSSEPGKLILTFDNQTSKKKKLLYRSKTKPSE